MGRFAVLMYHRIVAPGCPVPDDAPEEAPWAVDAAAFEAQLDLLVRRGRRGVSMREIHERLEAGAEVPEAWIGLTFDDGNRSDWQVAREALARRGFGATFYVCTARVGRPHGLDPAMVRELARPPFHVGAHGRTHRFLTTLDEDAERDEIVLARRELEAITGVSVDHFAPPGGRWSRRTLAILHETGYRAMATSDVGFNASRGERFVYRRVAVTRATSLRAFARVVDTRAGALALARARHALSRGARRLLGEGGYAAVRARLRGDRR